MNPRSILYCIEPGQLPAAPSTWRRFCRRVARLLSNRAALLALGTCGGLLLSLLVHRVP